MRCPVLRPREATMTDFFDKIRDSIDKGITTVSVKSRQLIETQKIRNQIDALDRQRKTAFEELGKSVYDAYTAGGSLDQSLVETKCRAVKGLDDQIIEREKEIANINREADEQTEGTVRTAHRCECGAELPDSAKFCGKCGKGIDLTAEQDKARPVWTETRTCPACSAELSASGRFCPRCGKEQE